MATYYYGETLLPEVPVLDGYPDYIIIKDERFTGYKYRVIYTTQGFVVGYGDITCKNQNERQNYLLPDGSSEWVEAVSVVDSAYSYFSLTDTKCQFIFTNRDINDSSTDALRIAAMTPTAVTKNILVYLHNATANAENPSEISDTATLRFTPNGNAILPDSVVVFGASYTWDATTGTLELSGATATVRVWVGYAKQYRVPLDFLISIAEATRAETGKTDPLTLDEMVDSFGDGSDESDESDETHAFYNGVRLPKIPEDVLAQYPYAWIRNDGANGNYNLVFGKQPWYFDPQPVLVCGDNSSLPYYSIPISSYSTATEWTNQKDAGGSNFGLASNRTVLWSNHDIPNGSATATDIYFYGHEPIPCY